MTKFCYHGHILYIYNGRYTLEFHQSLAITFYFAVQLIAYSSVDPFISIVRYSEVCTDIFISHLLSTMHAFSTAQLSTK